MNSVYILYTGRKQNIKWHILRKNLAQVERAQVERAQVKRAQVERAQVKQAQSQSQSQVKVVEQRGVAKHMVDGDPIDLPNQS